MSLPEISEAPLPSHRNDDDNRIQALLENPDGYVVGRFNNELLRFNTDAHLLTISPTGGGKTTGSIIPNLLDHTGSAFVIDIRGETVAKTANAKRLQGHHVIVLDPYDVTEGIYGNDEYNPFDRITNDLDDPTNDDRIQRLVQALMFDPHGRKSNEPIWDNATKNLLTGLIKYCVYYLPAYQHNLYEILDILNYSTPELELFIERLLSIVENNANAQQDQHIKGLVKILTESKASTKITDNALVQAQTYLNWVGNRSFKDMTSRSTFTFEDLQERLMTVYLVIPEEFIDNCATWTRIIIESAVFSIKDVFKTKGISTSFLPQSERVLFLLDELPAFGQLDIISKGMATLRGRGINLWLFIQNISQLQDVYEEKKARTIIGNAACIQVFKSDELEELEYFSKLIGEEFVDVQSISIGESVTEGTSDSEGYTHTINNSESFSQTQGTSDSYSESTSRNWGESFGTSENEGFSINSSYGGGTGTNSSVGYGSNVGGNMSYQRNFMGGGNYNSGRNYGTNRSLNRGRSNNRNWNKGKSYSKGKGSSYTQTSGHSESETRTHGTNQSTSTSRQSGTSEANSRTHTTNHSVASSRNISVKKERMKMETVRSLREKLSRNNQLLLVKGEHPFFCQKMSYFVKYSDLDRYIFPDFVAMISQDIMGVLENGANNQLFSELLKKVDEYIEYWTFQKIEFSAPPENMKGCVVVILGLQSFFENDIMDAKKTLDDIIKTTEKLVDGYEYTGRTLFSLFSDLAFSDEVQLKTFQESRSDITTNLTALNKLFFGPSIAYKKLKEKYEKLSLLEIKIEDEELIWETNEKYFLTIDDAQWLIEINSPIALKIIENIANDFRLLKRHLERIKSFEGLIHKKSETLQKLLPEILAEAINIENANRSEFFMKQQGLG
jgi:type IV secretion system protein VirD4